MIKCVQNFKHLNALHRFDLDMLCEHNHEHSLVRELWPTRGPICLGRNSAAKPWCCWDTTAHTVSIGTPLGSPRSRRGHSSHNVLQLETRTNASQDGASTVMCVEEAGWEGMPNPVAVNENESCRPISTSRSSVTKRHLIRLCKRYMSHPPQTSHSELHAESYHGKAKTQYACAEDGCAQDPWVCSQFFQQQITD